MWTLTGVCDHFVAKVMPVLLSVIALVLCLATASYNGGRQRRSTAVVPVAQLLCVLRDQRLLQSLQHYAEIMPFDSLGGSNVEGLLHFATERIVHQPVLWNFGVYEQPLLDALEAIDSAVAAVTVECDTSNPTPLNRHCRERSKVYQETMKSTRSVLVVFARFMSFSRTSAYWGSGGVWDLDVDAFGEHDDLSRRVNERHLRRMGIPSQQRLYATISNSLDLGWNNEHEIVLSNESVYTSRLYEDECEDVSDDFRRTFSDIPLPNDVEVRASTQRRSFESELLADVRRGNGHLSMEWPQSMSTVEFGFSERAIQLSVSSNGTSQNVPPVQSRTSLIDASRADRDEDAFRVAYHTEAEEYQNTHDLYSRDVCYLYSSDVCEMSSGLEDLSLLASSTAGMSGEEIHDKVNDIIVSQPTENDNRHFNMRCFRPIMRRFRYKQSSSGRKSSVRPDLNDGDAEYTENSQSRVFRFIRARVIRKVPARRTRQLICSLVEAMGADSLGVAALFGYEGIGGNMLIALDKLCRILRAIGIHESRAATIAKIVVEFRTKNPLFIFLAIGSIVAAERLWPADTPLDGAANVSLFPKELFAKDIYAEWVAWPMSGTVVSFSTVWTQIASIGILVGQTDSEVISMIRTVACSMDTQANMAVHAQSDGSEPAALLCNLRGLTRHLLEQCADENALDMQLDPPIFALHDRVTHATRLHLSLSAPMLGRKCPFGAMDIVTLVSTLAKSRWDVAVSPFWFRSVLKYTAEYFDAAHSQMAQCLPSNQHGIFSVPISVMSQLLGRRHTATHFAALIAKYAAKYGVHPLLANVGIRYTYDNVRTRYYRSAGSLTGSVILDILHSNDTQLHKSDSTYTLPRCIDHRTAALLLHPLTKTISSSFESVARFVHFLHVSVASTYSNDENIRALINAGFNDGESAATIAAAVVLLGIEANDHVRIAHLLTIAEYIFRWSGQWDGSTLSIITAVKKLGIVSNILDDVILYLCAAADEMHQVSLPVVACVLEACEMSAPSRPLNVAFSDHRPSLRRVVHYNIFQCVSTRNRVIGATCAISNLRKFGYSDAVCAYIATVWQSAGGNMRVLTIVEFENDLSFALGLGGQRA